MSISVIHEEANSEFANPGLGNPCDATTLASLWGCEDGFRLEDQRGGQWFQIGTTEWMIYNDAYIAGAIKAMGRQNGRMLKRARLCVRHARALQEVCND